MDNFKALTQLKFWCQKVLPLVYDDSLSYFEVLCKVQEKLNEIIKNNNLLPDYIKELIENYISSGEIENVLWDILANYILNVKFPPNGIEPASGDGTTDDTTTIQACIDYAFNNGGKAVFFPSGKYLTRSLTLKNNVTLCGLDSNSSTIVLKGGATSPLLAGNTFDNELINISFNGNADTQVNNIDLISLEGGRYRFNNIYLTDGYNLLNLNIEDEVIIDNVIFDSAVISSLVTNGTGLINANGLTFKSLSALRGLYAIDNKVDNAVFTEIYSACTTVTAIRNTSNNSVFIGQILNSTNTHSNFGENNYYEFYSRGGTISALINAERVDRENADNALENLIETETTERINADSELSMFINNAKTVLENSIETETTARELADSELEDSINALSKNQVFVNVKSFGAVGDGLTNDSPAFQAAIDSGYDIFIPTSRGEVYLLEDTIHMSKVRQVVFGDVNSRSMENNANVGYIDAKASPCFKVTQMNVHFQSLSFKSHDGDYTAPVGIAIDVDATAIADNADCYINDCFFFGFDVTVKHIGRGLAFINNVVVESRRVLELSYTFDGMGGSVLQQPDTGFRALRVINNRYHGVATIVHVVTGILVGPIISLNDSDTGSALLVTEANASVRYGIINSNSIMFTGSIPISFLGPVEDCVISENVFTGLNNRQATYFIHAVFNEASYAFNRNVISNNVFNWCRGDGMLLNREIRNCIISGNSFRNIGSDGTGTRACIRTRSLTNCSIIGNTFDPLFINRCISCSNLNIVDSHIESNSYGSNILLVNYVNSGSIIQEYASNTAPTSGTWKTGAIVYKSTPTDFIGWVCVNGGSPGTWKTFGAVTT